MCERKEEYISPPSIPSAFVGGCIFVSAPPISGTPLPDGILRYPVLAVRPARTPGGTAAEEAPGCERLPPGSTNPALWAVLCLRACVYVVLFSESPVWQDVSASTA